VSHTRRAAAPGSPAPGSPAPGSPAPGSPEPGLRPCEHTRAHHTHGTRAAYNQDGCRCQRCRAANAASARAAYFRRRTNGQPGFRDAEDVRAHIRRLRAEGIGFRQIADLSSTTPTLVRRLSKPPAGNTRGVTWDTAERVLSITAVAANRAMKSRVPAAPTLALLADLTSRGWTPGYLSQSLQRSLRSYNSTLTGREVDVTTERRVQRLHATLIHSSPAKVSAVQRLAAAERTARKYVDSRATRRRLQALLRLGWTVQQLGAALGRSSQRLEWVLDSHRVTAATAQQVSDIYERLSLGPPTTTTPEQQEAAEHARTRALRCGWLAPLAWDDIDNDPDPGPSPAHLHASDPHDLDEIAIERAVAGGLPLPALTALEQAEAVRRLTDTGHSLNEIAERLSTTSRTVSRRRSAHHAA